MEKFKNLTTEEVIGIINNSKDLRDILDKHIQQCEMNFIEEKISEFKDGAIKYCIDPFELSYLKVMDNDSFVEGVESSGKGYGLAQETENILHRCQKLRGSNLYGHWVKKLRDSYFKQEIQPALDWILDCSFELYRGKVGDKSKEYVDNLVDNYLGGYLWDKDIETYYIPKKATA